MMGMNLDDRFWEVDLFRGLAVVMMVIFHFVYDLNHFGVYGAQMHSGSWFYFARTTAAIFLLLAGISLVLSYSRAKKQGLSRIYPRFIKRGLWIFFWGMVLTLATYYLIGEGVIVFGILHLIGVSIILAYPFLNFRILNLFMGQLLILIGLYLQSLHFDFSWLLWLGLAPKGFYSLDYVPLLPWFGVVLIGIFLGNCFYGGYRRRLDLPDLSNFWAAGPLCLLGRKSLLIYLIHQPLLIATLYFLGLISWPF